MSEKPTKPWHVERTSIYGSNGVIVATLGGYTVDADSALVAAAPELLAACRRLIELHAFYFGAESEVAKEIAIVAKAEGRTDVSRSL